MQEGSVYSLILNINSMNTKSMQMYVLIVTLFTFGLFYSCSDESAIPELQEEIAAVNADNVYQIPIDHAIAELHNFLESFDDCSNPTVRTRTADRMTSLKKINMNSIITIKRNKVETRTLSSDMEAADLLYVVNFDDNKGYAVLSADKRIPAVVLAMVDTGSASIEDFQWTKVH